ncbi:AbrB/MazE/SpoVT family DNA-binding domain-containing protein [Candidatus Microgenomates bacterium]|nr:AbrB/MazE/SpoVT family DNA-binding domain-containing protein [Candidatus Microgenomates bacterium]
MQDTITIRPRRQITLPKTALEAINVEVGEELIVKTAGDSIVLQPTAEGVISTFTALQKALQKTTTLSSLQKEAKKVRKQVWQEKTKTKK